MNILGIREMAKRKKSWREKLLDSKDLPKVVEIPEKMQKKWGKGTLVIPAPIEVDEIMKMVPFERLITINEIRKILARRHGATIGCPMTTGIFAKIAAEAAIEDQIEGKEKITPFWRTLKSGGEINQKYPGGITEQKRLLLSEGHNIIKKGKKYFVEDYQKFLMTIEDMT